MKRPLLTLFILLLICRIGEAQVNFQDKMAITETVTQWNSAMHMSTIGRLNDLYAPELLINGEHKTKEACIKEKSDLVNQFAGIHQEIISPINITFYESGSIKCSFNKRVRYKDTVTDYRSYLLLQKVGDHYQITGEGGQVSEQSLKAGLKLGEEVSPPTSDSAWVIFCAASLFVMVVVIWMMGKSSMAAHNFVHPRTRATAVISDEKAIKNSINGKFATTTDAVSTSHASQSSTKNEEDEGRVFEEFILDKFPKDKFSVVERRSDQMQDDGLLRQARPAETPFGQGYGGQGPDLQLKLQSENFLFAIVCKWKNDFWKGIIEWARQAEISSYQEFQTSKQMPVFIVLGVGGTPSEPRDLFIIPLSHLYQKILTQDWLKKYKREKREDFSLNLDPISLS